MADNESLHGAKKAKNDEFYISLSFNLFSFIKKDQDNYITSLNEGGVV